MQASILISNVFANKAPVLCKFGKMLPLNYTMLIVKPLYKPPSPVVYFKK